MRIGVISDTHGEAWTTAAAVRIFQAMRIDRVIHCGDVGSVEIVALLDHWPCDYVLGNTDHRERTRRAIEQAGQTCHGRFAELEFEGRRIAVLHGDDGRRLRQIIRDGGWDLICHGHTHFASVSRQGPTLVLNPGAIQRTTTPSVAVVDLPSLEVTELPL